MSSLPPDDRLIDFLRQNRPTVPAAAPDLESRIFAQVCASVARDGKRQKWRRPLIAATILAALLSCRLVQTLTVAAQFSSLEAFLETSWHSTVGDGTNANPDPELAASTDLTTSDLATY
jgi:hypothetical protein